MTVTVRKLERHDRTNASRDVPNIGLGMLLRDANAIFNKVLREELAQYEITFSQYQHLRQLWQADGLAQVELSGRIGIETASSTAVINQLEKRGFIRRKRDASDRRRIIVPSGLYGMTTAADPVADYRLKLLVSLGRLGRLSTFWRPFVTPALARRARGRVVVDLLPAEHAHAVDLAALDPSTRVVRIRFVSPDGRRAVGHEAKSVKGRLARAVLDGGLDAVGGFTCEGWRTIEEDDVVTVVAPDR